MHDLEQLEPKWARTAEEEKEVEDEEGQKEKEGEQEE